MAFETTTLKIKAERLGSISEITGFLNELETTYNSLYAFDFIVRSLPDDVERGLLTSLRREKLVQEFLKGSRFKDISYDYERLYQLMESFYFDGRRLLPPLASYYEPLNVVTLVPPSERLLLSKVNIQSPGFWEVLGTMNPLNQMREYLKDRHERRKDRDWREAQEKRKGDLDIVEKENSILNARIDTLKKLGYSDVDIRQMVMKLVLEPLTALDKYQDNGQIEGPGDEA
ncbi:MAG: hypothetical protein JWP94_1824 [Mucilaginibacter sp.]|nr:hypothetical protein [Mucilaginibacter sp.]